MGYTPPPLSTGDPPTLGNYRRLAVACFGPDSPAVAFLDQQIAEHGPDELVVAPETQMVHALGVIAFGENATRHDSDWHLQALDRIAALLEDDPAPDSVAGRELIKLVDEVEAYERVRYRF